MTVCIMIDSSPNSNMGKRRLDTLNLACRGSKRGKVFSYYPSVANHRHHSIETLEHQTIEPSTSISSIPTAADYANLVFLSSDDEEEEAVVDEPLIENSATGYRKHTKRRHVSFGSYVPLIHHLHDIPLASEMTLQEKSALWLNSEEIEEMKASANTAIHKMRNLVVSSHRCAERTTFRALMMQLEKDTDSSIRGLEHRVFRRKVPRQVLVDEVLECQKHIQGLAKFGHAISVEDRSTLLANVSFKRSHLAVSMALTAAKNDALEVNYL
ncbi:hypothetical protein HJC23_001684 [Cyclotella cryptica]|uniref:Uncharacterized protein n=1 Tax=Cyclotella cryptica TaxID=29204 RepID=A0ABD3QKB1_9STRA|eukprot:CCRYP_004713-RA/>CCRYP_004713-RA protein AED:0.25 eAED:0.25 QI:0/-1/0/1/-1/1/1/0/268